MIGRRQEKHKITHGLEGMRIHIAKDRALSTPTDRKRRNREHERRSGKRWRKSKRNNDSGSGGRLGKKMKNSQTSKQGKGDLCEQANHASTEGDPL